MRRYYYFLTNEGIDYLREVLHLPPQARRPSTLASPRRRKRPGAWFRQGKAVFGRVWRPSSVAICASIREAVAQTPLPRPAAALRRCGAHLDDNGRGAWRSQVLRSGCKRAPPSA